MTTTPAAGLAEQVLAHALEHYEDGGWDVVVECKTAEEIAAELTEAGVTDLKAALAFYAGVVDVWADRQADARNSAF